MLCLLKKLGEISGLETSISLQGVESRKVSRIQNLLLLVWLKDNRYAFDSPSKWAWDRIIKEMFYEQDSWKFEILSSIRVMVLQKIQGELKVMCSWDKKNAALIFMNHTPYRNKIILLGISMESSEYLRTSKGSETDEDDELLR